MFVRDEIDPLYLTTRLHCPILSPIPSLGRGDESLSLSYRSRDDAQNISGQTEVVVAYGSITIESPLKVSTCTSVHDPTDIEDDVDLERENPWLSEYYRDTQAQQMGYIGTDLISTETAAFSCNDIKGCVVSLEESVLTLEPVSVTNTSKSLASGLFLYVFVPPIITGPTFSLARGSTRKEMTVALKMALQNARKSTRVS